jgi:hypothetical protein
MRTNDGRAESVRARSQHRLRGSGDLSDSFEEIVFVERLLQNRHGRLQSCAPGEVIVRRDEDDRELPAPLSHLFFHLETADAGQTDVDDGAVGVAVLREIRFT